MDKKIKVLVVDDSAVVRQILLRIFKDADDIEVVATAPDPIAAKPLIEEHRPDVLTLDVEMPKMNGITFLRQLMHERPMPVVMISSFIEAGAELTVQALEIGAVDYITKPRIDSIGGMDVYGREVRRKVRVAAKARVRPFIPADMKSTLSSVPVPPKRLKSGDEGGVIAIGASTGGIEAVREILVHLPQQMPAIVISQHIPDAFVQPFASRLNRDCALTVKVAEEGERLQPGHAYLSPGERHLMIKRAGSDHVCRLSDGPPVRHYRPSIDLLLYSVALSAGDHGVGVLLTGMGDDGANGLREMHASGAITLAQDEQTSVVWGMPQAAGKLNAVDEFLPLPQIAARLGELSHDFAQAADG